MCGREQRLELIHHEDAAWPGVEISDTRADGGSGPGVITAKGSPSRSRGGTTPASIREDFPHPDGPTTTKSGDRLSACRH